MDRRVAAQKIAAYERTLNPQDLWPGVTEPAFASALRDLVRVTSLRLTDPALHAVLEEQSPEVETALGPAAFASGLGPLLGYWVESGDIETPPRVADLLRHQLAHGRRRAARLRAQLERIVRLFADAGITPVILKGMHTGWAFFPDPGTRPATDIDVLIPADQADDAGRVLVAAGFTRVGAVRERSTWSPPGDDTPASVDLTHADNPWTLDLHLTLDRRLSVRGPMVRFDLDTETDLQPWTVGSVVVRVLAPPLLASFLAVHATNHFPYVSTLRLVDLVLMFRHPENAGVLCEAVGARLGRAGLERYAYPALKLAADLGPGTIDCRLLESLHASTPPRVRNIVGRMTPATSLQLYHRSFEGRFLWVESRWGRLMALATWLWPLDSDGGRMPFGEAVVITGRRLRRLLAGRLRWRAR